MPNIMSFEEIKEALADRRLYMVAEATGLSYPTIKKFADGKAENVNLKTLELISSHLQDTE